MKSTPLFLVLVLVLLVGLLAPSTTFAMPAGDGSEAGPRDGAGDGDLFQHVVESRRTAGERYQALREKRLESLNRSAARGAGQSDRVPGWNLTRKEPAAAPEEIKDTKGLYILLLVGAGVVLSLLLRILAPFLFHRPPKQMRLGEPMTIKLKPREERKLRRA